MGAREVWVLAAVRTPIGRHGGALASVRPDDLAAVAVEALVERSGIDPAIVDDVIMGCANQAGEDNRNVARMAALRAGLGVGVPGQTVNRLCGSGMQAIIAAGHAIAAGEGDLFIAGGVESMSRAPLVMLKAEKAFARGVPEFADTVLGWRFANPAFSSDWTVSLGETAERVAEVRSVTRELQDEFAVRSQKAAHAAMEAGRFDAEIVPVEIKRRRGVEMVDRDEHPRPGTDMEELARLRPVFRADGSVTAGNSSGLNDGAATLLLSSSTRGRELGLEPMARFVGSALAGVEPDLMGLGPVPASGRALRRAGWQASEIELAEVNEAFAAQAVPCIREIGLDPDTVNVNGGAIALGHPLGCSGARIVTTLVHEMKRRGSAKALATMCIGVGQGIVTLWEGTS